MILMYFSYLLYYFISFLFPIIIYLSKPILTTFFPNFPFISKLFLIHQMYFIFYTARWYI